MLTDVGDWTGVTVDNYTLEFELGEPSERTKQVALNELRETPENRQKGLEELNKLLDSKYHMHIKEIIYRKIYSKNITSLKDVNQIIGSIMSLKAKSFLV